MSYYAGLQLFRQDYTSDTPTKRSIASKAMQTISKNEGIGRTTARNVGIF